MSLPQAPSIEMPILQELAATGGRDDVRFLYERLIGYFPQIEDKEISEIKAGENRYWRKAVQKAGRYLDDENLIKRERGLWAITEKGRKTIENETSTFALPESKIEPMTHVNVQELISEIGNLLGYSTMMEFEFYDVVWRENEKSQRLSHVFEVQSKGNIDSAFAKLKRAYEAQRTKPFLVIASERDLNRARKSLALEFQDIESVVTVLTFAQIKLIHRNLKSIGDSLLKLLIN
jgi:hypothetical protein